MAGTLALLIAAMFAGAAIYVSFAEHPARMQLDSVSALKQWKPAYEKGALMQASLAVAGTVLGVVEYFAFGHVIWLVGAVLLAANWPYTMFVIMPTNNKLKATGAADEQAMALLTRWGGLHFWRGVLGGASALTFALALYWELVSASS